MKVDFWQLSDDPVAKVVALIAARVLGSGERLLVVHSDAGQREAISTALWETRPDEFLANGQAAAAGEERQPILLSERPAAANGASHVIFADGAWRDDARAFERSFLLFDEATLNAARECWRGLDGIDDLERSFFRQEDGKWTRVA